MKTTRKLMSAILAVVMTMSLVSPAFAVKNALGDNTTEITNQEALRAANPWFKLAWKIFTASSTWIDLNFGIHTDPSYYDSTDHTQINTETIKFGTGDDPTDDGSAVSHIMNVTSKVKSMEAWITAATPIGFLHSMTVTIDDANRKTIAVKSLGLGVHWTINMSDLDSKSPALGEWKITYTANSQHSGACYYRQNYNISGKAAPMGNVGIINDKINYYLDDTGKVSLYSTEEVMAADFRNRNLLGTKLNMTELTNQFKANNGWVNNLRDYDDGDTILFEDIIDSIYYNEETDSTIFEFVDNTFQEPAGFEFRGNLTDSYQAGETLTLHFKVVQYGEYENHVFEELNYHQKYLDQYIIPEITDYLVARS